MWLKYHTLFQWTILIVAVKIPIWLTWRLKKWGESSRLLAPIFRLKLQSTSPSLIRSENAQEISYLINKIVCCLQQSRIYFIAIYLILLMLHSSWKMVGYSHLITLKFNHIFFNFLIPSFCFFFLYFNGQYVFVCRSFFLLYIIFFQRK